LIVADGSPPFLRSEPSGEAGIYAASHGTISSNIQYGGVNRPLAMPCAANLRQTERYGRGFSIGLPRKL
jgi:hypothetical protein